MYQKQLLNKTDAEKVNVLKFRVENTSLFSLGIILRGNITNCISSDAGICNSSVTAAARSTLFIIAY